MKRKYLTLLTTILSFLANAQNGTPYSLGAKSMSMGHTSIANQDEYSLFSNPSAIANQANTSFAIFGEQRFIGTSINNLLAGTILPTKSGNFGLQLQYYGIADFNEQKIAISYGKKLFKQLNIGVQFDFFNTKIKEYGNAAAFTFNLGFTAPINKFLTLGGRVHNPIRSRISTGENIPSIYTFGFSYHPDAKVTVNGEVEKMIDHPMSIRSGISYWLHPKFAIRLGASSNPTLVTMGFGLKINKFFNIDIGTNYHQMLGFTPGLGANYQLDTKQSGQ